ncbi:MAG: hypothetical protein ACI376_08205 [Candidatus Bruticola sp.]
MLRCPACQAECSEETRFCMECGAPLSKEQPRQSVSSFGFVQTVARSQENYAAGGAKQTRALDKSSSVINSKPSDASRNQVVSLAKDDIKASELPKKTASLSLSANQNNSAASPNRNKRLELVLPNNSAVSSSKVTAPLSGKDIPKSPSEVPSGRTLFSAQQRHEGGGVTAAPFSSNTERPVAFSAAPAEKKAPGGPFSSRVDSPVVFKEVSAEKQATSGSFSASNASPVGGKANVNKASQVSASVANADAHTVAPRSSAVRAAASEGYATEQEKTKDKSAGKNILLGIFIGGCGCAAALFIIFSLFLMFASAN